ncbi:hypothetical protein HanRHA438_Chr05g0210171 [Helianthus annuus]|uniref:Uncharacterized protein n=1 Tax=Helianthus annuus TaxID=4232 RepID=A0A9K3IXC8_HELAN|nr:hypothetical protein HanXRQr2_Chr05g0200491 [Helianthus annuus]KAJ0569294.1 hypothetical protein HanHA300_Chr05g0164521 [Helianthus annuus]KAJ0583602.1 hypothetical protein HanHA89_Chr05g0178551 [Helianthus annuus]KAJ0917797.1 hypothetical protein HanRHA438_Chr05g0210171 [Helianthus annuus]
MADPTDPFFTAAENPEPLSPMAEEEAEVNNHGKFLPVLRWTESSFQHLMTTIQMPDAYAARYPKKGDTAGDAPAGYVNLFADWFGLEPLVGHFRCFYQLTVQLGFFSFRQREGAPKLRSPPKGITKWKTKFFNVKAAAVTAKLQFRNVTGLIATENLSTPKAGQQAWFSKLRVIGSKKFDNRQLWVLWMMVGGRLDRKARPVLRENNEVEAPLWRMFCPYFEGKIAIEKLGPDEEGWNQTILSNFRIPDDAALNAVGRQR